MTTLVMSSYNSVLRNLVPENRVELRAGNIVLNKHVRPWAKVKESSVEVKM